MQLIPVLFKGLLINSYFIVIWQYHASIVGCLALNLYSLAVNMLYPNAHTCTHTTFISREEINEKQQKKTAPNYAQKKQANEFLSPYCLHFCT